MTEAEWLAGVKLWPMLELAKMQPGVRKLRLFGIACCRRVWHLFSEKELSFFDAEEQRLDRPPEASDHPNNAANFAWQMSQCCVNRAYHAALAECDPLARNDPANWTAISNATFGPETVYQCRLARCVFNPFRHLPLCPSWHSPTVLDLAEAVYRERLLPQGELDPARLSVLADALEELGADAGAVAHLRSVGPHVRGCWPVDLLTGRS